MTPVHSSRPLALFPLAAGVLVFAALMPWVEAGDGTPPAPPPHAGDVPPAPPVGGSTAEVKPAPSPNLATLPGAIDVGHIHNLRQVTPKFVRGSAPVTEEDFVLLAKLGVKVVVSVDGARPNVEAAHKAGLRYVHVPIGYDGIPRAKQVVLYKAFTTLEGPFFVHCHHGKHRGPAACAIGLLAVEGWTVEQIVAEMKAAGTAPKYDGLYAVPGAFSKPTPEELAAAPAEIPEVAPVPAFQQSMVELDDVFDRLKAVKKAKWKAPPSHPDVDPKHEAVILAEAMREMARCDQAVKGAADFRAHIGSGEKAAWELAGLLEEQAPDAAKADAAFARVESSCTLCHAKYRDPSSRPR